jgi:hypothetical protein
MPSAEAQIESLLDRYGAVLTRTKKHLVYKFPDGKTFVCSSTPSDVRANLNKLATLRRVLGLQPAVKAPARPSRRPRRTEPTRTPQLGSREAPMAVQASRKQGWPPKLGEVMTRDMWSTGR